MPYVFNLKSKSLAPLPSHPGADPKEFISKDAIIVTDEQARLIGKASRDELERITTHILGKRLMTENGLSAEHRKILEAGMTALGIDDLSEDPPKPKAKTKAKAKAKEEAVVDVDEATEDEDTPTISVTLDTGDSSALLSKAKVSRLNQASLVKYARNALGMEVADNENFELLKRKVLSRQFGESN